MCLRGVEHGLQPVEVELAVRGSQVDHTDSPARITVKPAAAISRRSR